MLHRVQAGSRDGRVRTFVASPAYLRRAYGDGWARGDVVDHVEPASHQPVPKPAAHMMAK